MRDLPTASEIEAEAKSAGLSITALCEKAGVHPSTFHKWKSEQHHPKINVVQRFLNAIKSVRTPQETKIHER